MSRIMSRIMSRTLLRILLRIMLRTKKRCYQVNENFFTWASVSHVYVVCVLALI
jgi:hypothetical protein